MCPLTPSHSLFLWEQGLDRHPVDRALLILAVAFPERSPQALAQLSIGQRDALLMQVRRQSFGRLVDSWVQCPACQEQLEFGLDLVELEQGQKGKELESLEVVQQVDIGDWRFQVQLPNSLDLAAIASCKDVIVAKDLLIQRCLLKIQQTGNVQELEAVPEAVLQSLTDQLTTSQTTGDVELDLTCPACKYRWQAIFDILTVLWSEIGVQAKRLLREVDALARVYGWREADILAMSSKRRQLYLEMLS